ncbi:metallophosphoesterase [Deferribacter thermophilus]|uniref:metallophosphoesterase n=1 Tax=Deferribacter thermophilus TaxID=53573 RepID=UPI003C1D1460
MFAVIGDVHGCVRTLDRLLNSLIKNYSIDQYIFVGDLIDRGNFSKDVLNLVKEFSSAYKTTFLLGNHEDMMIDYFEETGRYNEYDWFYNGGKATLRSFDEDLYNQHLRGVEVRDKFVKKYKEYLEFIKSFEKFMIIKGVENYFISHAGCLNAEIIPKLHLDIVTDKEKEILFPYIWTREIDFYDKKIENYIIIHGHTPVMKIEKGYRPFVNKNNLGEIISINIDTGCVYGYYLSSVIVDDKTGEFDFEVIDCID